MAYKDTDFQLLAGLNDVILYAYKSTTDNIATITSQNYFPKSRFYSTGSSFILIESIDTSGLMSVNISEDGVTTLIPPTTPIDAPDFIGDSGSGGVKGFVPAPAVGDSLAGKFIHADGTWKKPPAQFDATVGVAGQYATVNLAILDGKKSIIVVGNAVESTNIVLTNDTSITINNGIEWDMANFQIQYGDDNLEFVLASDGIIKWSPTVSKSLINGLATQGSLFFRYSIQIDGTGGTANNCPLYSNITSSISTGITRITVPNQNGWGIHLDDTLVSFESATIVFLNLNTAGTNIYNLFSYTSGFIKNIKDIILVGNFSTINSLITSIGSISNISVLPVASPQSLNINIGGSLESASVIPFSMNIIVTENNAFIGNCDLNGGDIDINSKTNVVISNVLCNDILNINANTFIMNVKRATDTNRFIKNIDIYTGYTPINYTSANTKIKTELEGIDNVLGTLLSGISNFECDAVATTNINISNPATSTFDGLPFTTGMVVFLLPVASTGFQTNAPEGGLYIFNTSSTPLVRKSTMNTWGSIENSRIYVRNGGLLRGGRVYVNTNTSNGTINVTYVTYIESQQNYISSPTKKGVSIIGNEIGINIGNIITPVDSPVSANDDLVALINKLQGQINSLTPPIGKIDYFPEIANFGKYKILNGQAISRTAYSSLFAKWSTTYGSGDGSTTFNVPDMRDKVLGMFGTTHGITTFAGTELSTALLAHTHGIDHDHPSVTSSSGSAHSHPVEHTHGIDHDHVSFTSATGSSHSHTMAHTHSIDHDHSSFTSSAGSSHGHDYLASGNSVRLAVAGNDVQIDYAGTGGLSGSVSTTYGMALAGVTTEYESAHTHIIDIPSLVGTSGIASTSTTSSDTTHTHSIDVPAFTGTSGVASISNTSTESTHTHTVDVSAFTGISASTGAGTNFSVLQPTGFIGAFFVYTGV